MDVQTKANFVPAEAAASTIWPLILSDGHTGGALEPQKKTHVDRKPFSGFGG